MLKASKILGTISLLIALFMIWFTSDLIIAAQTANDGWLFFGFLIFAIMISIATAILSIPFIIFLIKLKYPQMKYYFYTHIGLVLVLIISITFAVLMLR